MRSVPSAVPDAATTLLRLQSSVCHTLGDTGLNSKYTHITCRVPHKASNAQWNVHSSQASKDARSQHTANTNAANQQVPKTVSVHYKTKPSGTMMIYPLQRHINLPITLNWHYSNNGITVLANQLIGTVMTIRPGPPGTGPRPTGSLVPVLGPASAVGPMATPRDATRIPTTTPPMESFCPQKQVLSFVLWNPGSLDIPLERVWIAKIRRGDPFSILHRIPLPKNQKFSVSPPGLRTPPPP